MDSLYSNTLARLPGGAAHAQGPSSLAWSDLLIEELKAADAVVIATPEGKIGTLADRPVYIAISSGGPRTGDRARQPDFLEPYLRAILPTIGLKDLRFVA
ncbi:hypothetical protein [Duganella sp. BuS-21]|uniref:hypothetical protein n=1 Tax=Duganella sp. BuS-21 TaxID=2943848 RepID=UPI0035A6B45B